MRNFILSRRQGQVHRRRGDEAVKVSCPVTPKGVRVSLAPRARGQPCKGQVHEVKGAAEKMVLDLNG